MKKFTLFLFALATTIVTAQTTFDITWMQGVNGDDASLTIAPGDTVRWTWGNGVPHNVESTDTDAPGDFGSGTITGMGTIYEYTFTIEAIIDYLCTVHPDSMFGTITIEEPLSVQDQFAKNVKFYPNPVHEKLTIGSIYELDSYLIHDVLGKLVSQGSLNGNLTELDMSQLNSGMYFITARSGELQTTFKVTKR